MDNKNKKIPNFWDIGCMIVTGCTQCSDGCDHCWSMKSHAMRMNNPAVQHVYSPELMTDGKFNGKVQFNPRLLENAIKKAKPGQVIALWNDLYHEGVTLEQTGKVHRMMDAHPQYTFLIVTKRIERAAGYCNGVHEMTGAVLPDHIWHIVTCENQAMADKRIPHLLKIPGKRGIIIEPMLEPIILKCAAPEYHCNGDKSHCNTPLRCDFHPLDMIHQVICGPENGPGKRPFDPAWADEVKTQCEAAGVPFYRKDTGDGELAWRTS